MSEVQANQPIALGTPTRWGRVSAVMTQGRSERYYLIVMPGIVPVVSLLPAMLVEAEQSEPES